MPSPYPYRTALVTGASSGIGAAMARMLAARGVTLVLVARRTELLDKLAAELRAAHGIKAVALTADLTDPGQVHEVEELIAGGEYPIELLVNNAGIGNTGAFVEQTAQAAHDRILLNTVAPTRLCRAALPAMLEARRGGILNVSSLSCRLPSPHLATYAATKAFVTSFGESLAAELRGTGVRVTTLLPGLTRTEIIGPGRVDVNSLPRFVWLDAEHVAAAGLNAVATGRVTCVPGTGYRAAAALTTVLPAALKRAVSRTLWQH
nr:SDR family oxidoreductase [Streptomyces sp. SID3343]